MSRPIALMNTKTGNAYQYFGAGGASTNDVWRAGKCEAAGT